MALGVTMKRKVTTRGELERVALELFVERGFDATTVEEVAAAAGIGRRTFFRYFASKNDVVWGEFDALLADMARWLDGVDDEVPLWAAVADAVVRFNSLPAAAMAAHRERMELILHVPALQAHSTLRYAVWRRVVADFAARRLGVAAEDLEAQLVGHLALGTAVAAYEAWLADSAAELPRLLRTAFERAGTVPGNYRATDGGDQR